MNANKVFCVISITILFLIACKRQPIGTFGYSIPQGTTYSQVTDKKMHDAIISGLQDCGWKYSETSQNVINASLIMNGKHTVFVIIPYTSSHYDIKYKDSAYMKYKIKDDGTEYIHKAYNQWVSTLNRSIQAYVMSIK